MGSMHAEAESGDTEGDLSLERAGSVRKAENEANLWMFFQDCSPSRSMRLFVVHPQPVIWVLDGFNVFHARSGSSARHNCQFA